MNFIATLSCFRRLPNIFLKNHTLVPILSGKLYHSFLGGSSITFGFGNFSSQLLFPRPLWSVPERGLKYKGMLKRRCKDCYFVMRDERMYVMCKTHPRHKQASFVKPEKFRRILSHATQSPIRPW